MPIRLEDRSSRFIQIVKVAELMWHVRQTSLHRLPDGLLTVRDDAFDWHLQVGQHLFHLTQEGSEVSTCTAEQRSGQQHLTRQTIANDPQDLVPHIWLPSIYGEENLALLLESSLDPLLIGQVQGHQLFV